MFCRRLKAFGAGRSVLIGTRRWARGGALYRIVFGKTVIPFVAAAIVMFVWAVLVKACSAAARGSTARCLAFAGASRISARRGWPLCAADGQPVPPMVSRLTRTDRWLTAFSLLSRNLATGLHMRRTAFEFGRMAGKTTRPVRSALSAASRAELAEAADQETRQPAG